MSSSEHCVLKRTERMKNEIVKIIKFPPEKYNGCFDYEKAFSQVHFKTDEGGNQ